MSRVADRTQVDEGPGWEAAGRRIAPMLGSYHTAVVTATDPLAAAHAAIGIGLAEAEHRRVAIGDLVGEVAPIQALVSSDDPHGISDSFTYGVSLNKIAQPIDTTGNLFVMPSGTGSVADPAIFANARWQRLANGFREVGALLLLVAPADAPGLKELIDQMDGVVLVGPTPLDLAPYLNVLARIPTPLRAIERAPQKQPLAVWKVAALILLLLVLAGAGVYWRMLSQQDAARPKPGFRRPAPTAPVATAGAAAATPSANDTVVVPPVANPADSATASAYAVELGTYSARDDAMAQLAAAGTELRAVSISPVPQGPQRQLYYHLVSGAYPTRREAVVLLDRLQHLGIVGTDMGTVIRAPYALLIDSAPPERPNDLLRGLRYMKQQLYVLQQADGSIKAYAGAFEHLEDAAPLLATFRAAHVNAIPVYRTGRSP